MATAEHFVYITRLNLTKHLDLVMQVEIVTHLLKYISLWTITTNDKPHVRVLEKDQRNDIHEKVDTLSESEAADNYDIDCVLWLLQLWVRLELAGVYRVGYDEDLIWLDRSTQCEIILSGLTYSDRGINL